MSPWFDDLQDMLLRTFSGLVYIIYKNIYHASQIKYLPKSSGATSCKKSTRKNKLIRKNKSTRTEILYLKISVLVDLFFLIDLFFLVDFLHEAAPRDRKIVSLRVSAPHSDLCNISRQVDLCKQNLLNPQVRTSCNIIKE